MDLQIKRIGQQQNQFEPRPAPDDPACGAEHTVMPSRTMSQNPSQRCASASIGEENSGSAKGRTESIGVSRSKARHGDPDNDRRRCRTRRIPQEYESRETKAQMVIDRQGDDRQYARP
jgi:hypothetical protein